MQQRDPFPSHLATSRETPLFEFDIQTHAAKLEEKINGKKFLFIGAAGSIGSQTLKQLLRFNPASVDVVDVNENALAELVRDLRSGGSISANTKMRFQPLDYGSKIMERFLLEGSGYSGVFHFAALKHVRSEKDTTALLQMIDTNIVKQARLLEWLRGRTESIFAVSTDKAANPVNLMGASKRFMEAVIFSPWSDDAIVNSARFANVAFSNGSLLQSWSERVRKSQPVPVPKQTTRFFVSLEECGKICLLSGAVAPGAVISIPKLDPATDLVDLQLVAEKWIKYIGLEAVHYEDPERAVSDAPRLYELGKCPLLLTPLDTSGEKAYEEFVGDEESLVELPFRDIEGVVPMGLDQGRYEECLNLCKELIANPTMQSSVDSIAEAFSNAIPTFQHASAKASLDDRV